MGNQQGKLQNQNQIGRPKKMVHWKSAERPSPPGRPILIPGSEQQPDVVQLHWERPKIDGGSPITGYVIEHRRMGSPHWVRATPTAVLYCEASISGLEPGWRYQFRVFAENVVGRSEPSELSDALTVTLQRNAITVPRFADELQDVLVVEDERIEFRVRVLGQPPPEISWFKDGYEIFSSRRTKIVNDNDASVLVIHQVALSDEGEIKCTATNRAGHVVTKARLLVQAPPKIRLPRTYEDGLIIEADEVLRLKVGVAGQPAPSITWLHEGEVLTNGGRFEIINSERNSMLKIDSIQRNDRGEYSVRASNRLGDDVTSFLVTVTARPNPPGKVRLNMSFGKSATLSWIAPIDDGGCKIGTYIVEYFRVGWNVWLKAATTRSLSTTLNDLIEGSEYKFRVKAENPYGVSDPSEESDILFIPDPKRGITKPKSASKVTEDRDKNKPVPPVRKTLSPSRPQQDVTTTIIETFKSSPRSNRKVRPEVLDSEELHREMSYGTPDQALKNSVRKSPSLTSADSGTQTALPNLNLQTESPTSLTKSPQRSPTSADSAKRPQFLQQTLSPSKDKTPSPHLSKPRLATPERTATPEPSPISSLNRKRSLSPVRTEQTENRKHSPNRKSPTPPDNINATPALKRSAEPVHLGVNQQVRRYSGHGLSPLKDAPALAIAIAMSGGLNISTNRNDNNNNKNNDTINNSHKNNNNNNHMNNTIDSGTTSNNHNNNNHNSHKQNASTLTNPTIQISAPPPLPLPLPLPQQSSHALPSQSQQPASAPAAPSPNILPLDMAPLSRIDKHDDVQTSNEFMLVVFNKNSKVKDKDKQDSFELDLEDAIQPPPISISSPDLASLEFTNLHTFPLRRAVSSTELLYERAMARFYEAVELEEAEKARKLKSLEDKPAVMPNTVQPTTVRKRLGSMTEAERRSFERRSELRRQSADIVQDLKTAPRKWGSRENVSRENTSSRGRGLPSKNLQESQESEELSDDYQANDALNKNESDDLGTDYTESTASSEDDSIEKFKMEMMARTRSPSPRELETYHPRNMSAGVFTPYRAPTAEQATVVLTRPMPLPSPDFVPKPILKRSSNENVQPTTDSNNQNGVDANVPSEKLVIAKGIKSFFKRDKRTTTEKNTEENQLISDPNEKINAVMIAAEVEAKRKAKEEEERKRKEAERIMMEEAHAAADHYSDLVQQVSSSAGKYHTPLYLDRDELKRAAEKAAREGNANEEEEENMSEKLHLQRSHSPDMGLIPPISNKPRLSISERGQMMHVRESGSNLAFKAAPKTNEPDTPSEDISAPLFPAAAPMPTPPPTPTTADREDVVTSSQDNITTTVISETTEERLDSRGRTRIVKVKRIIKKRMPSGTRSRDTSTNRTTSTQDINSNTLPTSETQAPPIKRRIASRTRTATGESRSPGPLGRRPLPAQNPIETQPEVAAITLHRESIEEVKSAEQLSEETHEKVRSALSYSTDVVLFVVACYVYLFKDARLVLPILALMIYRQLGEVLNDYKPAWLKRKKE